MSGILIEGMEMPTSCFDNVMICNDGRVYVYKNGGWVKSGTAVPVPPHGRLINADALYDQIESPYTEYSVMIQIRRAIKSMIKDAPTIIPAEEGKS